MVYFHQVSGFYMSSLDIVIPPLSFPWVIAGLLLWMISEEKAKTPTKLGVMHHAVVGWQCTPTLSSQNCHLTHTHTHKAWWNEVSLSESIQQLIYSLETFTTSCSECAQQLSRHRGYKIFREVHEEEEEHVKTGFGLFLTYWIWISGHLFHLRGRILFLIFFGTCKIIPAG